MCVDAWPGSTSNILLSQKMLWLEFLGSFLLLFSLVFYSLDLENLQKCLLSFITSSGDD